MSNAVNLPLIVSSCGFSKYLRDINSIPSLSKEEEFSLAKSYLEQNNLEAAQKLVTSHLKLVAKIAMGYKNYGLPVTELVSEGNLGLMQAVKKYDPDLGFRLSTYAMWWIKAAIQEYVLKSWSLVKIGTTSTQKKLFFSLGKIKNKITSMYSRNVNESDYKDIAAELGVSIKEVSEMNQRLSGPDLSLNRPSSNNNEEHNEMIDFLPESKPNQELVLMNKQNLGNKMQALSQAMKILDDREINILTARKLNEVPITLDSLSLKYNISKERVRQIENRAFEKVQSFVLSKVGSDGQIASISK